MVVIAAVAISRWLLLLLQLGYAILLVVQARIKQHQMVIIRLLLGWFLGQGT
jgi:hypothetical protein